MSLKKSYLFLMFAILTEVLAVNLMKASEGEIWGLMCMYVLLVLSYYFGCSICDMGSARCDLCGVH